MDDFFDEIIRQENLFFRGVTLGANTSEVEAVEGVKYRKKTGSTPALHYSWETGAMEDIDLYFGLDEEDKVNDISLKFYTRPNFYHEKLTGEDFTAFEQKFYKKNIEESLAVPNSLLERILSMLTNDLGTPVEEHKDEIFNKDYHNFKRWIWITEDNTPLRLSLTSYLDDSDGRTVKWILSILLSENIIP